MITTQLTMLKAEEGYVLKKDNTYTSSVLLREGETADGWTEIPEAEYQQAMKEQEAAIEAERAKEESAKPVTGLSYEDL